MIKIYALSTAFLIITSYHIVDLKQQNRLKVGKDKPMLEVKM